MTPLTQGERIASLETTVADMKDTVAELKSCIEDMKKTMEELLALRNKGAGVFWFLSTIVGGGAVIYSFLSGFLGYFKHG